MMDTILIDEGISFKELEQNIYAIACGWVLIVK